MEEIYLEDGACASTSSHEDDVDGSYDPNAQGPTEEQYAAYQSAYDHFNAALFAGRLPPVVLTLAKRRGAYGYYAPDRWGKDAEGQQLGEIALNPEYLRARDARSSASTLVHEMVHHWQALFAKPGRRGYHNAQWAAEMERVGLMPSNTGEPGGKRTGQRVTHYVVPNGEFATAFEQLAVASLLPFSACDGLVLKKRGQKATDRSKAKFECPCGQAAWGKEGLRLRCAVCGAELIAVGAGVSDILTPRPKHLQIMPFSGLGRSKTCDICAVCAREIVRVS
jgi:hypothetical protein